MLRDIRRNGAQPKDTMHKAKVAMVTGMGAVKEDTKNTKEVKLPTAETTTNIYLVTKERIPTGINAARQEMSDYDDDFTSVKIGEFVGLEVYTDGEKFGTDQFKAADFGDEAEPGFAMSVGADGKWQKATKGTSRYVFAGTMKDNGHKLVLVEVVADAVSFA